MGIVALVKLKIGMPLGAGMHACVKLLCSPVHSLLLRHPPSARSNEEGGAVRHQNPWHCAEGWRGCGPADYLLVVVVALVLSMANVVGYTKCSKEASQQLRNLAAQAVSSGFTVRAFLVPFCLCPAWLAVVALQRPTACDIQPIPGLACGLPCQVCAVTLICMRRQLVDQGFLRHCLCVFSCFRLWSRLPVMLSPQDLIGTSVARAGGHVQGLRRLVAHAQLAEAVGAGCWADTHVMRYTAFKRG